jgi:hypothetical protein
MRNVYQVLREREIDLERVRHEVEALRMIAPLLMEGSDPVKMSPELTRPPTEQKNRWPLNLGEPPEAAAPSAAGWRPS